MSDEQIEAEVIRRYPKNEDERRGCQSTIYIRNQMRNEYKNILKEKGEEGIKPTVIE